MNALLVALEDELARFDYSVDEDDAILEPPAGMRGGSEAVRSTAAAPSRLLSRWAAGPETATASRNFSSESKRAPSSAIPAARKTSR